MASKLKKTVKKRIIPAVLALAMLLSLCPAIDFSSSALTSGDFVYNKDNANQTAEITLYKGSGGAVTIPNVIGGCRVTRIGDGAFESCEGLTSISIPDSVTSIGTNAFQGCKGLTSISIPDSVTSIGTNAFYNCTGLESITVGENNPNYSSFDGILYNKAKTQFIHIPKAIKGSVTIPNSVTSIGNYAFYGCTGLENITIPSSVTNIGDLAFYNCTSLTDITAPKWLPGLDKSQAVSFTVSDGVTSIGGGAFQNCTGMTSISIPSSVTTIGYYAFSGCTSLTNITAPKWLPGLNESQKVESFTVSDGVTSIGDSAFLRCTGLESITIPDSVKSIGNGAFNGCTGLTNVTIGNSVETIGNNAFSGCTSLTNVKIPGTVTNIDTTAFLGCTGLESITVNENNPNYISLDGVLYNKDKTELITYPAGKTDPSFTIPSSVKSIGSEAFYGCKGLTSISIHDSVKSIGEYAFHSCTGLTSINIPDSVKSIGNRAFRFCTGLTSVTIGNFVESIGGEAFQGCTSLTGITIPKLVKSIGDYTFNDCKGLTSVTIGSSVESIGNYAFYRCGSLTSISIPNKVNSIGDSAFGECTGLATVYIKNPDINVDAASFSGCSALMDVYIKGTRNKFDNNNIVFNNATVHLLEGLSVTPTKSKYQIDESLDTEGMVVTAAYTNSNETEAFGPQEYTVSGFDSDTAGNKTVTVTVKDSDSDPYLYLTNTFEVNVVALEGITVKEPTKTQYVEGQKLDKTGMVVKAQYSDGTSEEVPNSGYTVSGFDPAMIGTQTITVSYKDKSKTFTVEVVEKAFTGIAITTPPTERIYIEGQIKGQKPDTTGMVVKAQYNNDTSEPVTGYTVSDLDPAKIRKQKITVSYGGKTASFTVKVFKTPEDIKELDPTTVENDSKITTDCDVIGAGAFGADITSVKIGENVLRIDDKAFTTTEPITIYGYEVSAAQSFCERAAASGKNITFKKLPVVKGCVTGYIPDPSKPNEVPQATMSDALALFKAIVYDETDRLFCWQAADMNGDGDINLVDCLALLLVLKNQTNYAPPTKQSGE